MNRPPIEISDGLAFAAESALKYIEDHEAKHRLLRALLDYARAAGLDLSPSPCHLIRPETAAVAP